MVKKKKAKGGKKKDAKKEAGESQKKPKKPTEKELFEIQVENLRERLEEIRENLASLRDEREACKTQFESETESREACVAHLQRVLRREGKRRSELQERLQTERELGELAERRILGRSAAVDRNNEASRGVSLQQKMELEGKLSLLEELRLARDSQTANLRRVETALAEKAAALSQKIREEDRNQVDRLLLNREGFVRMCKEVRKEWSDVFKLRMPVHAQKQLEENIRLRGVCRDTTKTLLHAQDQSRLLKQRHKSQNLEEEIQTFAEENTEDRKGRLESRLKYLLQVNKQLNSPENAKSQKILREYSLEKDDSTFPFRPRASSEQIQKNDDIQDASEEYMDDDGHEHLRGQHVNIKQNLFEKYCLKDYKDRNVEECQQNRRLKDGTKQDAFEQVISEDDGVWNAYGYCKFQDAVANTEKDSLAQSDTEGSRGRNANESWVDAQVRHNKSFEAATAKRLANEKLTSIKKARIDRCRLEDKLRDVEEILEDQSSYKRSLESEIERQHVDRNGVMMSAILRAGKIFESRCCKMDKNDADLDFDVLHQIRMLLDFTDLQNKYRL